MGQAVDQECRGAVWSSSFSWPLANPGHLKVELRTVLLIRIVQLDRVHAAEDDPLATNDAFAVFGGVKDV